MAERPRVIDAHTHISPEKAPLAVEIMDRAGIAAAVVAEWYDGFDETLEAHLEQFDRFEGRFFVFGYFSVGIIYIIDTKMIYTL